jgi:hypothetical protein
VTSAEPFLLSFARKALLAGGLWGAAFGAGLGDVLDDGGDLSDTSGERPRPLLFFLGLLFFVFCTLVGEASTATADSGTLLVASFLLTFLVGAAGAPAVVVP